VEKLELSALLAETKGKSYFMYVKFIDGKNARSRASFLPVKKGKAGICLKTEFALNWREKPNLTMNFWNGI